VRLQALVGSLAVKEAVGTYPHFARYCFDRMCGLHRAAFWEPQGYFNLMLARAAKAEKRRLRKLEEWRRGELERTPYALLDDPPEELRRPVKRPQRR
jgi:hypothetical protein